MLLGVEAHIWLLAGTQTIPLLAAGTPQRYLPPYLLYAPFPSRHLAPHPLIPLPSLQTTRNNMATSKESGYSLKAEVVHAPQSECPLDRKNSPTRQRELSRDPATRGGGNHQRRVPVTRQKTSTTPSPRLTSIGLGGVSTPALASPGGAPPAPHPRTPQGTTAATWALRALQSAIPRALVTGAPCRLLGLGICVGAGLVGAR